MAASLGMKVAEVLASVGGVTTALAAEGARDARSARAGRATGDTRPPPLLETTTPIEHVREVFVAWLASGPQPLPGDTAYVSDFFAACVREATPSWRTWPRAIFAGAPPRRTLAGRWGAAGLTRGFARGAGGRGRDDRHARAAGGAWPGVAVTCVDALQSAFVARHGRRLRMNIP